MTGPFRKLADYAACCLAWLALPILVVFCLVSRLKRSSGLPRLLWGPTPIISYKYWSLAMQKAGYESKTMMLGYYASINKANDYDTYCNSWCKAFPAKLSKVMDFFLSPLVSFVKAIWNFNVHHLCFHGGYLGLTAIWRMEAPLLKLAGVKTVVIPYGADAYMYSRIVDVSLRHVLNISYPEMAREEPKVAKHVFYWSKWADAVIANFMFVDGLPRNDVSTFSCVCIDTDLWQPSTRQSPADGRNGAVRVIHTPNHRGFKGTEFLLKAIDELKSEGLQIELILLERLQNDEVRRIMTEEADILAEQFIATAYALSGIEGMATGLPVMANLDNPAYTQPFRRFSYLNECPILSTSPENLKPNLRVLVTNPELRATLGRAGRNYVEKYHSERMAQALFPMVYDRIWFGKEVDLINLFHPLVGGYAMGEPKTEHSLINNRLPC